MANSAKTLPDEKFVQILLKHQWRVRAFVATMLGRPQNIEDVVQDIYAIAWTKRSEFTYQSDEPDEEFVRWVCTIGRYESLKSRRQQSAGGLSFDNDVIERLVKFQFDESEYLEARRRALSKCIENLSGSDQRLVRRRYAANESVEQIADQDGKTVSAIYKALKRVRRLLQNCIGGKMSQEGY